MAIIPVSFSNVLYVLSRLVYISLDLSHCSNLEWRHCWEGSCPHSLVSNKLSKLRKNRADINQDIPKSIVGTSVAAILAYANAKFGIASDAYTFYHALNYALRMKWLEKKDRINVFYIFEKHALNPKSAARTFLLIPNDPEKPDQRTSWTYAEAYEIVLKYAAWLKSKHSVQKGEIIAMDFTNKPQFVWVRTLRGPLLSERISSTPSFDTRFGSLLMP